MKNGSSQHSGQVAPSISLMTLPAQRPEQPGHDEEWGLKGVLSGL